MRLLFTLLLLVAVFVIGYGVGGREQFIVKPSLDQLKDEMARKTLELERHLTKARVRGRLIEMRDALTLAQTHIRHKDYGLAKSSLTDAQQSLQSALRLDETGVITKLKPIEEELKKISRTVSQRGPRAIEAIDQIKQQIADAR